MATYQMREGRPVAVAWANMEADTVEGRLADFAETQEVKFGDIRLSEHDRNRLVRALRTTATVI